MTHVRFAPELMVDKDLDNILEDIKTALSVIFSEKAKEDPSLGNTITFLNEYWLILRMGLNFDSVYPKKLKDIDVYYNNLKSQFQVFISGRFAVPENKQQIIVKLINIFHLLARLKFHIGTLNTYGQPYRFAQGCINIGNSLDQARNIGVITEAIKTKSNEINYFFHQLLQYLKNLGYVKNIMLIRINHSNLNFPSHLKRTLEGLPNNEALNRIIDQLNVALENKDKKLIEENSDELNGSILSIISAKLFLQTEVDDFFKNYNSLLNQQIQAKANFAQAFDTIQENNFVFQLSHIEKLIADDQEALKTAMDDIAIFCDRQSLLEKLTFGLMSSWTNVKNNLKKLTQWKEAQDKRLHSYTGNYIDLLYLQVQSEQYGKKFETFNRELERLDHQIKEANRVWEACVHGFEKTETDLRGHLEHDPNSFKNFIYRHWLKLSGGGTFGGSAGAVIAFLLGLHPAVFAIFITSMVVVGSLGGAMGGVAQDTYKEHQERKKAERDEAAHSANDQSSHPSTPLSDDSDTDSSLLRFWQPKPAAVTRNPPTTTTQRNPFLMAFYRNSP